MSLVYITLPSSCHCPKPCWMTSWRTVSPAIHGEAYHYLCRVYFNVLKTLYQLAFAKIKLHNKPTANRRGVQSGVLFTHATSAAGQAISLLILAGLTHVCRAEMEGCSAMLRAFLILPQAGLDMLSW